GIDGAQQDLGPLRGRDPGEAQAALEQAEDAEHQDAGISEAAAHREPDRRAHAQGRVAASDRITPYANAMAPTMAGSRGPQTDPRNQWGSRPRAVRRRLMPAASRPNRSNPAPTRVIESHATPGFIGAGSQTPGPPPPARSS